MDHPDCRAERERKERERVQALADVTELKELAKLLIYGHMLTGENRFDESRCVRCERSKELRAKHGLPR